jgi:hypothetical protein
MTFARPPIARPPVTPKREGTEAVPWSVNFYRYFFYAWLFRDADSGTSLERSAALRHNCEQARWLPTYMFRWLVVGTVLVALEQMAEAVSGDSLLSATLALLVIFVVLFQIITGILWAFLQASRQSR